VARWTSEDPIHSRTADPVPRFARRIGWYALVRCLKPKVVVETGVDKGLGSVVLTAALLRNGLEGHPGRYYGTDINPKAGYLLKEPYAAAGKILIGDSIESLKKLGETIDLFINDSDHSAGYEGREYETVERSLAPGAVVIGDNAHVTDELLRFARRTGRTFLYFQERPKDHWYPGGGIGVAFHRRARKAP
jgi:predicted O-methyltransferase YrrM